MQSSSDNQITRDYYSKAQFWDQRYDQKGGFFDWYAQYPELKYCFENQYGMSFQDSILMVGCGNSKLSQQMYDAGYKNIVNIDISPVVIQQMRSHSPQMEWLVMDATQMTFQDNKFDFVIDKGTMDALIAGRDLTPTTKLLQQCIRVTKEEGQLILITYGSPQGRKKIFETSLSFNVFDYYFCFVNLNDMSTMINLMRNNSVGPNGQQISKQDALQRSMKEFMMIKIMRQRRSKDKQFVVWENYMKKQQKLQTSNNQAINQTPLSKKNAQNNEQNSKKQVIQGTKKQQNTPKVSYMSKPQKQSYVYAYSIKRKFAYEYKLPQNIQKSENKFYQGRESMSLFQLKGADQLNGIIKSCIQYCKDKQIGHSGIIFKNLQQKFQNNEKSIKINIQDGPGAQISILKKTNIQFNIKFSDFNEVIKKIKGINNYLLQKIGVVMHPCPKTYSLFAMIRNKMKVKTVNQLLSKYWYSTYKIQSIDMVNNEMNLAISIPPVLPKYIDQIIKVVTQYLNISKETSINLKGVRNGYVTFPQLGLFSVLNLSSLSHNKGSPLEVIMSDFWQDEGKYQQQGQSNLYIINNTHIKINQNLLPYVILHIICLY